MKLLGPTNGVTNTDDTIDSRDIIARIKELEEDTEELEDWEQDELESLQDLNEDGETSFSSWEDGISLIRDSFFEDYAQELAEDIGAISDSMTWPVNCIDWEEAANILKLDYTLLEFDRVEYWAR